MRPVTDGSTRVSLAARVRVSRSFSGLVKVQAAATRARWGLLPLAGAVAGVIAVRDGTPGDYGTFVSAGADLIGGRLSDVYADPGVQAGPLQLLALTAFRPLDRLHAGLGLAALDVVGSIVTVVAIALAVGWFRRRLLMPPSPSLQLAVGLTAALWGASATAFQYGHPAQVVVPAAWLAAAAMSRDGRSAAAGITLGLACGWETWAVLGLPVLLLAPSLWSAMRAGIAAAVSAVMLFAPFVIAGDFAMFRLNWSVTGNGALHLLFPNATTFTWQMRAIQTIASLAAAAAVGWLLRRRADSVWLVPLVAVLVRLALDPLNYTYYQVAPQLLVLFGCGLLGARRPSHTLAVLLLTYATFVVPVVALPLSICAVIVSCRAPHIVAATLLPSRVEPTVAVIPG